MQELVVNGVRRETGLPGRTPLLAYLRNDLELNGPKYGCGLAECGSCTVLVDGAAARACVLTLADVHGRAVLRRARTSTRFRRHSSRKPARNAAIA
jgi:nicotinate dehydrogenase subunit A